jgi:hypothetical protein
MANDVTTAILPAFLASALLNGDLTGLEDSDMPIYEAALAYCKGYRVVDVNVGESYFSHSCDLPMRFAGDVAEYTLLSLSAGVES